ncbi:MAG: helix-turn-helix transcriptional regulator [Firmicutes bacterium]|nr:helix-turn-helix transcriptional regulator [Bacillota bacterium]
MDYKTADRLIKLRKKSGYSQEELAEQLNISRQAISKWERGESLPDTENLIGLAALYGISIDELIHGNNAKVIVENGVKKPLRTSNMKLVRTPFRIVSIVHLIIGISLLGVAAILLGLSFAFDNADATLALKITSGALAFSGLVETILGIVFRSIVAKDKRRTARLKQEGQKFEAQTIDVKWVAGFMAGHYRSAKVECSYINNEGKSCLVKSKMILARMDADFGATIYVNHQNPTDYIVEVFSQSKALGNHDHDYR